jgi:type VI secretion system secreted protein Hcp
MSVDYFLKIEGIEGEAMDDVHKNEIMLTSFDWEEVQSGTFAQGAGGGSGKVKMGDFNFTMRTNKSSPKLMLACAKGDHIKEATLTCRKAGGGQQEFFKLTMKDILVSKFQHTSHSEGTEPNDNAGYDEGVPRDHVSFNFAKIESEYRPQKEDGSLDNPVKAGYDLKANKAV